MGFCRDIAYAPQLFNLFCLIAGSALLGTGAFFLFHRCARAPSATTLGCAEKASTVDAKYFVVFGTAGYVLVTGMLQACFVLSKIPCCGLKDNTAMSIFLAGITAIAATVVASELQDLANTAPRSAITDKPICLYCPDAGNGIYSGLMWAGPVSMWIGLLVVSVSWCFNYYRDSFSDAAKESLNANDDSDEEDV